MTKGTSPGSRHPLLVGVANRIGRGLECQVILTDPLTSRVHAEVVFAEDAWWLRDRESRNGCYLNDQKVLEAQLVDGSIVRFGSTEFAFSWLPEDDMNHDIDRTIVFDRPFNITDTSKFASEALADLDQAGEILELYQLTIKLLACESPTEVEQLAVELLHNRVGATVTGLLWLGDDGQLKPKLVIPEEMAETVTLSESLTKKVCEEKHAIRLDDKTTQDSTSLTHFSEAICTPLMAKETAIGALHLYRDKGRFRDGDFDFCVSISHILSIALARARREAMLKADMERLVAKSGDFREMIGDSEPMLKLKSKITRIARATGCVLVRGESGSGKELVARALHRTSPRADRPMLSVNCAAIPADLIESQLFGHKKGAFTSAEADHVGWFSQADSGTLFLDEVGELPLEGQAKLLRILEGHPFLPVGGVKEISVDVRVIAATNRDLSEFVREKKFREDLYYRLSVFELELPPLRERGTDIELLLDFFLNHFRKQHGRTDLTYSKEAKQKLIAYNWPGNVRQLRNVIDSAVVMAEGDEVEPDDLPLRQQQASLETLNLSHWEEKLVRQAIERSGGNVQQAATLLGIGRATLYRKIKGLRY